MIQLMIVTIMKKRRLKIKNNRKNRKAIYIMQKNAFTAGDAPIGWNSTPSLMRALKASVVFAIHAHSSLYSFRIYWRASSGNPMNSRKHREKERSNA